MHEWVLKQIVLDIKVHSLYWSHLLAWEHTFLWFLKNIICKKEPKLKANLKKLFFWNIWALNHDLKTTFSELLQKIDVHVVLHSVGSFLDQTQIILKYWCDGETNLPTEILEASKIFWISGCQSLVLVSEISIFGYIFDLFYE